MTAPTLINSTYPEVYWNLPNIDEERTGAYEIWWSSEERPKVDGGTDSAEYLEIDYGRKRVCNYMSFDITRKPVTVTIEYDAWSHGDRSLGSLWLPVTPLRNFTGREDSAFENFISYSEGANISPWEHVQFFFADVNGEAITTQRFRIKFARRDAEFPRAIGQTPSWSVDVRNLRSARYVVDLQDARGILIEADNWNDVIDLGDDTSVEVRQNFVMPGGYVRSPQGGFYPAPRDEVITEMIPSITGFGFHVSGPGEQGDDFPVDGDGNFRPTRFAWQLLDVTDGQAVVLKAGEYSEVRMVDRGWVDVLFNPAESIATDVARVYQIRLRSLDLDVSDTVFTRVGNPLKEFADQDTAEIDAYVATHNVVEHKEDTAILFRIWSDVGESGKDIFGNEYREGVRRDAAENVNDDTIHTNWVSGPNPDPAAVECLYFDVRKFNEDTAEWEPSIVDSLRVNPITPGVFMTVYYSNDNYRGNAPKTVDYPNGWEGLRWTPIIPPNHPYQLLREQTYTLPRPIRASFICLEFTSLQPLPYRLNEFIDLPAIRYKTFPESVYNRIKNLPQQQGDMLPDNEEKVLINLFALFRNSDEFAYSATPNFITSGSNTESATPGTSVPIDPRTLAQVYYMGTQMYYTSLPTKTDRTSVLGSYVASAYSFGNQNYAQTELVNGGSTRQPTVSNTNERDVQAYQTQQEVVRPLWFPQIERHPYAVVYAKFRSQKAYFAGIAEVQFYRRDYTIERDDQRIHDVLADSQLIESPLIDFNTWQAEIPSTIPVGAQVWVNYTVGAVRYEEPLSFEGDPNDARNFDPVLLLRGGSRAINVEVYSGQGKTGTKYILGTDYDLIYDEELGANYVQRNSLHYRLVSTNIKIYDDISTVTGVAEISAEDVGAFVDAATATGLGVISSSHVSVVSGVSTYYKKGAAVTGGLATGRKISS